MTEPAFVPLEQIIASHLADGDGVLVDLNTRQYYQLNESAMLVWQALEGGLPLSQIVEQITAIYSVSTERATASAETLLSQLEKRKLIRQST